MIELSKVYSPSEKIILCPDPQLFSWQECLQSEEGTLPSLLWTQDGFIEIYRKIIA